MRCGKQPTGSHDTYVTQLHKAEANARVAYAAPGGVRGSSATEQRNKHAPQHAWHRSNTSPLLPPQHTWHHSSKSNRAAQQRSNAVATEQRSNAAAAELQMPNDQRTNDNRRTTIDEPNRRPTTDKRTCSRPTVRSTSHLASWEAIHFEIDNCTPHYFPLTILFCFGQRPAASILRSCAVQQDRHRRRVLI